MPWLRFLRAFDGFDWDEGNAPKVQITAASYLGSCGSSKGKDVV